MQKDMDILESDKTLKTTPFKVPDSYFESLGDRTFHKATHKETKLSGLSPYLALAAMFTAIVVTGRFVLEHTSVRKSWTEEDSFFYSELIPVTDPDAIYHSYAWQEDGVSEDDIIEYLIYSGITIENIENPDYEQIP